MRISDFRIPVLIIGGILLLLAGVFLANLIITRMEENFHSNPNNWDMAFYENGINDLYNYDPSLFEFNEENIAIIKVDDFSIEKENWFSVSKTTKDFDACVGYFIVKKTGAKFEVDISHICDMIDY